MRSRSSARRPRGSPRRSSHSSTGEDVVKFHEVVRRVPVAEELIRYAVRLASATRPGPAAPAFVNDWVSWGAGLRAAQSLILGSKARALLRGRFHVAPEDIKALIHPTFRHRILLGYRAEADGVTVERRDRPPARTREGTAAMTAALRPSSRAGSRPAEDPQRPAGSLIDPANSDADQEPAGARQGRGRGLLQGASIAAHSTASRSSSASTASTAPATIRVTSTGGSSPGPIAITSSGSRTRPTCAATWCSTPAGRWAIRSGAYSKSEYARTMAATIAYFLSTQRDAVGLITFEDRIVEYLPARYRPGHLRRIMALLEREPDGPGDRPGRADRGDRGHRAEARVDRPDLGPARRASALEDPAGLPAVARARRGRAAGPRPGRGDFRLRHARHVPRRRVGPRAVRRPRRRRGPSTCAGSPPTPPRSSAPASTWGSSSNRSRPTGRWSWCSSTS